MLSSTVTEAIRSYKKKFDVLLNCFIRNVTFWTLFVTFLIKPFGETSNFFACIDTLRTITSDSKLSTLVTSNANNSFSRDRLAKVQLSSLSSSWEWPSDARLTRFQRTWRTEQCYRKTTCKWTVSSEAHQVEEEAARQCGKLDNDGIGRWGTHC